VSSFERASLVVACITTVLNLVAVSFVGLQVRQAARQASKTTEDQQLEWVRGRKQATIEFIMSTVQLNKELKAALPFSDRDPTKAQALLEAAEKDTAVAGSIRAYLDYLEYVAAGVNEGVLDLGMVDSMSGGRIVDVARNYRPYIERRRQEFQSTTLYLELERLAAAIRSRRHLDPLPEVVGTPAADIALGAAG
jgi:Domain of unknown function (DUF4760)